MCVRSPLEVPIFRVNMALCYLLVYTMTQFVYKEQHENRALMPGVNSEGLDNLAHICNLI